jgi:hypothetical protein
MANKSVGLLNIVFGADLRGFDRAMKKAQKNLKKFGRDMNRVGTNLSTTLTLPILGVAAASVKMASDMEESINKVNVAFGDSSKQVQDFSNTTLQAFGIAKADALEMAALFGDMGTALGFSQSEAATMSQTLVGLAGDLASFKNIGVGEAQTALAGIFTGETESLKRLGIMTTEATLKNTDYFHSLNKTWKELTANEKIMVRYHAVMGQTANAQGDFSRTNEGFANQLRVVQGQFKDLGAEIGGFFMPIALKILAKVKEWIKAFRELDEGTKEIILKIALVVAAIGPLLIVIGKLSLGLRAVFILFQTSPIGLLITGIAALVGAFTWLVTSSSDAAKTIRNGFKFMANGVINSINSMIKGINKINPFKQIPLIEKFTYEATGQLEEVGESASDAAKKIEDLAKGVSTSSGAKTTTGGSGGSRAGGTALSTIPMFKAEASEAKGMFEPVETEYESTLKTMEEQTAFTVGVIVSDFEKAMQDIKTILGSVGDFMSAVNQKESAEFDIWKEQQNEKAEILDEQLQQNIEAVENSTMSEEEKQARINHMQAEAAAKKEALDKQVEKKERETKRKQAINDKAMGIANAIISTAEGVMGAVAGSPLTLGLPMSALIAGLGAAQIATIASTPIPFAKGGLVSGPTLGLIGEGSGTSAFNPEVVSPLDKLMRMMGGNRVDVHGRIEGDNIVLVSDKATLSRERFI